MNLYSVVMIAIDGTLSDSSNQVSANTKKLLNRLERRGIPVILCSARPPGEVKTVARQCELRSPLVCYSGGLILDEHDAILEDAGIDSVTAIQLKRFATHAFPDISVTNWIYDVWLVDSAQDPNVRLAVERRGQEAVEGLLENAVRAGGHIHKIQCMGQAARLRALWEQAAPLFPSLSPSLAGTGGLELISKEVSESTAMTRIQQFYHVTSAQMVVLGDHFMDVEVLRRAGLGIAMGNAAEAVRRTADRVTASNNEEGVYIALKNLRFRPPAICEQVLNP